jgi:hypothetical protein
LIEPGGTVASRYKRITLLLALVGVTALAAPAAASAWHHKFQDFLQLTPNASSAAVTTAKKCHGDKFGTYKFRSRAEGQGGQTEFAVDVRAKMPVTEKYKRMRDVEVVVESSQNIDPMIPIAISEGLTDFFDGTEVRWKPHPSHLVFDHPALVYTFFGSPVEVVPAGKFAVKFKPKPGC